MADQILNYVKQRRDNLKSALDAIQQKLTSAQANGATATDNLQKATTAFAKLEEKIAEIRKKLSAIPTPADGDLLLKQLEQAIIDSRAKQAEILAAQIVLTEAQSEGSLAQTDLTDLSAQIARAETLVKQAEPAGKLRDEWVAALTGPLKDIKHDATEAANDTLDPHKKAKERIEDDIPLTLLARAKARRAAQSVQIANTATERQKAETAVFKERDKNGGASGVAADRLAALLSLEAAAGDFVNTAKSRLEQAKAMLVQVADPANAPLTVEQKDRMHAPPGSQLEADREAAAVAEKNVAAERQKLEDAEKALGDAILELKAVPKDDPTHAAKLADVGTKEGLVNTAKEDLQEAEAAYKTTGVPKEPIMNAWEAAVPDATWNLLNSYEAALETLNTMPDPAALSTSLQTAETAYVAALRLADSSANVLIDLTAEQAQRAAREESARQNSAATLFSALRGDN